MATYTGTCLCGETKITVNGPKADSASLVLLSRLASSVGEGVGVEPGGGQLQVRDGQGR